MITRSGRRCRNPAEKGSKMCHSHRNAARYIREKAFFQKYGPEVYYGLRNRGLRWT